VLESPVISLLIQIPLVGIFVWFTLKLSDQHRQERKERDRDWREWLNDERRNTQDFLIQERKMRDEAFAKSFGRLAEEVRGVQTVLVKHDERAERGIAAIIESVRQTNVGSE